MPLQGSVTEYSQCLRQSRCKLREERASVLCALKCVREKSGTPARGPVGYSGVQRNSFFSL
jgi:hypothetical protein